jgi:hypothetical protein
LHGEGDEMKHGAYLLINVDTGKEKDVMKGIAKKAFVRHCSIVTGLHDLICFIESDTVEALKKAVFAIRAIPGINKTVTCISFNSKG